jgi:hypothetical protein
MKLLTTFVLPLALCCPAAVDSELWRTLMAEMGRLDTQGDFRAAMPLAIHAVEQARLAGSGDRSPGG